MKGSRIAYRYTKSLLSLAIEQGKLDAVHADMELVANTCSENHDLSVLLKSPIVKTDKKESILEAIFGSKISEVSMKFINIINRKKREMHLEQIANDFLRLYKDHNNISSVVLTSATPLTKEAKEKILTHVKSGVTGDVLIEEKVDSSLIGGFILRIGDDQIDTSVAHQLKLLKRTFSDNPYIPEL